MILDNNPTMLTEDEIINLATELVDAVESGDLKNDKAVKIYTYDHLIAMFMASRQMDNGDRLFEYCYDTAINSSLRIVKNKLSLGDKIRVAFLPISAAEWPAEVLYRSMEKDDRFEAVVIPIPFIGRSKEERGKIYDQTYNYFANNNYNLVKIYNSETEEIEGWEAIGGIPDIVVHVTPWYLNVAKDYQISRFPLSTLNVYIAYGFSIGNSAAGDYVELGQYNKEFFNICWRVYSSSEKDYEGFLKYQVLRGKNIRNSGYVKMDYFYDEHDFSDDVLSNIWKIPSGRSASAYKKILVTPHFSIGDTNVLSFSTFADNMDFWPEVMKKFEDSVSFIFKPHPNLRNALVTNGILESIDEYEAYLDSIRRLPNATVMEEGNYLPLFVTSDAMINDSISFLGEYLYVNKPMLFLTRPEQRFNDLGMAVVGAHYQCSGKDFKGIEDFIADVVVSGSDDRRQIREEIFARELDYVSKNGCKAGEYIFSDISRALNALS